MRRTSLSSKLLLAALPLLAALAALLAVTVLADLDRVDEAERDATLGTTIGVLLDASRAVTAEQGAAIDALLGKTTLNLTSAAGTPDADTLDIASTATDTAIAALLVQLAAEPGMEDLELNQVGGALSLARQLARSWAQDPTVAGAAANSPFSNYEVALRELHTVGSLLQSSTGDPEAGRNLLGVSQLSDANLAATRLTAALAQHHLQPASMQPVIDARAALGDLTAAYDQFDSTTTPEWAGTYRQSGIRSQLSSAQGHVSRAVNGDLTAIDVDADLASTYASIEGANTIQRGLLADVVATADADAADIASTTRVRLAVIAAAVLVATLLAWLITRSITRRMRAVARNANAVATDQLPALVDALRDPRGRALPEVEEVSTKGGDELAELAASFNSLQRTLHEVAAEQLTVLRRGVSDIFVTMARRNRSLVDRQLALLDEFEAEVEDPDVLASYYHLDHLATRMRRNSESLLVLANAEPRRGRVGPTDVDTVIRAAIGEVEDYRRIEIEHIDSLRVRGNVVADIAHLLAELLDNATAFSPPESLVRVGGRAVEGGYLVRIVDSGIGIAEQRLAELNDLLRNPPIMGLSVEPTLGISVVSLLANKHGIEVTLTAGSPGVTVDVFVPPGLFADGEQVPAALTPAGSDGATIGDLASALGLPDPGQAPVNGSGYHHAVNGHTHPGEPLHEQPERDPAVIRAREDAAVLAALEADLAIPEAEVDAGIDHGLTARLTDAFERADLTSVTDAPQPMSAVEPAEELPVRAGGASAVSAFRSFRAGADAAAADLAGTDGPAEASDPLPSPSFPAPSGAALPAPPLPAPAGEFARPPAPPQLPIGPSVQPVTPAFAQPAPRTPMSPAPDLPTRNRAAAAAALTAEESEALTAALAAFDAPAPEPVLGLPTRNRSEPRYTEGFGDDPTGATPEVTAASPLGADQLRARLRAFQTEFHTGREHGRGDSDSPHDSMYDSTFDPTTGDDLA